MREQDFIGKLFNELDQVFSPKRNTIPLDIKKTESGVALHFYVPGIKKEDIKLDVDHERNFSISVSPKMDKEKVQEWVYMESMSAFEPRTRSMKLNPSLDTESISASLNDGILVVSFSKKEKKEPVKIDIEIK